mgnify:CR=1 FL=1
MSKKERLKAQAQKQSLARKEQEEEERIEKEEAQRKQSKSAKKLRKKAKRDRRGREPIPFIILKILMLIPFGYSGFYYGGILISGIFGGFIEPKPPAWVGWFVLAGTLLTAAGVLIEFFKKHVISFITIAAGTVFYLKGVQYFINYIQNRLEKYYVEESLRDMDKVYMKRHYPIVGVIAISFIILVSWVIMKLIERKRRQHEKDTAPVKSIVD